MLPMNTKGSVTSIPCVGRMGNKLFDLLNNGAAYAMGREHMLL